MSAAELPFLIALPLLLILSGFFSGSETALFGLTHHNQMTLRQRGGIGAAATARLIANQRMLLITILLGNMVVNVLFFVISSVLTLRAPGAAAATIISVSTLVAIVLLGEVLPKLIANARRTTWCIVAGPVLLALHRAIGPLRRLLNSGVIEPAARLFHGAEAVEALSPRELSALLEISRDKGVIDLGEAGLLDAVTALSVLRVRDVMTPRVDMRWLIADARAERVRAFVRTTRRTKIPICSGSIDDGVAGVLDARHYLARADSEPPRGPTAAALMERPLFVPEQARLDKLLETFRAAGNQYAIVLDEYGAVAGVVTVADVAERLIAGILGKEYAGRGDAEGGPLVERLGDNQWRVSGRLPVHDWADAFRQTNKSRASTVGGLIIASLGRVAKAGDVVALGNLRLEVEAMRGAGVETVLVSILPDPDAPAREAP